MKKLKYMGISHEHSLEAGDDFGGRLAEGIPQRVVFNRANNWVVDPTEVGLSDDAVDILVSTGEWLDVTDMPRIPLNRNQTTFLAMKDGDRITPVDGVLSEEDYQYAAAEEDVEIELTPEEQEKRAAVEAERARLEAEVAATEAKAKVKSKGQ